jgi:sorting nexin-8
MDGQHEEEDAHEPDDIHAALRNTGSSRITTSSTWAGDSYSAQQATYGGAENYNQSIGAFGDHPGLGARHGSFGGLGGHRINGNDANPTNGNGNALSGLERVKAAMKAPEENVVVNILPEKEGMFMFQHRNYQITSTRRGSRVVRRYSDFVWYVPRPSLMAVLITKQAS